MKICEFIDGNFTTSVNNTTCRLKINNMRKLKIVRYDYKDREKIKEDKLSRYSRGLIIDSEDNILFLPPIKSVEISINDYFNNYSNYKVQPIIDGVMINLFNNNDRWEISTRSSVGGYNKWSKTKNFKDMYNDCEDFEEEDLNKEYTYSFVMRHKENRLVGKVEYNELYLIEVRNKNTLERLDITEFRNKFNTLEFIDLSRNDKIFNTYEIRGYTFYDGENRYKLTNSLYDEINALKGNSNDKIINYLDIRNKGNIKQYLEYYPEEKNLKDEVEDNIEDLITLTYMSYRNVKIDKVKNMSDIEYHIKPLVNELHKIYLQERIRITKDIVRMFINKLSIYKLKFILNYM